MDEPPVTVNPDAKPKRKAKAPPRINGHDKPLNGYSAAWRASLRENMTAHPHPDTVKREEDKALARELLAKPQPQWPKPFPGVMAEMVAAVLAVAPKPREVVTMVAVLAGMSAGLNGRWHLPSGMRLNQNVNILLPTGGGKDLPRSAGEELARAAGATVGGKYASGAALELEMTAYGSILVSTDEGAHLVAISTGKGAQHYLRDLQATKLKTYTDSKTNYYARGYANPKMRTKPEDRVIPHPCVTWATYSTIEMLASAMGSEHVTSGDLPRDVVVVDDAHVAQRRVRKLFTIPELAAQRAEAIRLASDWSTKMSASPGKWNVVAISDEADAALDTVMTRVNEQAQETAGFALDIMSRHYEKVERIAGELAAWDNPDDPTVTAAMVEWADELVTASDCAAINFFGAEVHDDRAMDQVARARKAIERALAGKGCPSAEELVFANSGEAPWSPALRLSKMGKEDFARAIEHLRSAGEVMVVGQGVGRQREVKTIRPTTAWGKVG